MSPFVETETFPRGRRIVLVPLALVLLIGPYGATLDGLPHDPVRWLVTMLSIGLCTAGLALGLARPRRRVVIGGGPPDAPGEVRISSTPPPPRFRQLEAVRAAAEVSAVTIEEVGAPRSPNHGFRVVVAFGRAPALHLRRHDDLASAQRTVDQLILLGLPGASSARSRRARAEATAPSTWI